MTKYDQKHLVRATGALISWLKTWCTPAGAYNGFVIHRTDAKRMCRIHDTAWTQAAIIRGFANLYRTSSEERWLFYLKQAADLQHSRFDPATGKYIFAGHEDDRFCSLVHCALANSALLEAASFLGGKRKERYVQAVTSNIDNYWMPKLWVESEGAFRFSETDFYSLSEDRFVINFNTMAAETLLKLYGATGKNNYKDTALSVGKWLVAKHEASQKYFQKLIEESSSKNKIPLGGLPYQFTPSNQTPDNCVCLYAGLALRGIAELYRHTGEKAFHRIARDTLDFLISMRDPHTRLFYHTTRGDQIEKSPQFVSGAGMTMVGMDEAALLLEENYDLSDTLNFILNTQYKNGSFPSFKGKNHHGNRKGGGLVWEDAVAGVNWNAQLFEYLTRKIQNPEKIEIKAPEKFNCVLTRRFFYFDSFCTCFILSWWPPKNTGLYAMRKTASTALALNPLGAYALLRKSFRSGR